MDSLRLLPVIGLTLSATAVHAIEDKRPKFLSGPILHQSYDGNTGDLLTAGLGATGLQNGSAPGFHDPRNPTAAELRSRAIYQNYRALVDVSANGGYGTLYGPTVGPGGTILPNDGKIAGDEYLTYARGGITMMVQVPASFDPQNPCIVAAPSSGSRGVYGAIGTAGEWGLKRGCAVAYMDKGTGNGVHDLQNDTVNLIDGMRASPAEAGARSNFTAELSAEALAAFNAATPNRFAFKHAHSQRNPESEWGRDVLDAIRLAFFVLNDKFGGADRKRAHARPPISRQNTIVIASSVSNGGGASLAAAERDRNGWIDAVVVSEPNIQLVPDRKLRIVRGSTQIQGSGKPLLDYVTIANLYQPCAALANPASPGLALIASDDKAKNRCASLRAKGLLASETTDGQAAEALAKLHAAGWEPDSDLLHASHDWFAVPAIAITYANAYGRFSVAANLCGFSFGSTEATTGTPIAAATENVVNIFANGNGIPPTGGIDIINNRAVDGPRLDRLSVSPSTKALDFNIDGALCLRARATSRDPVAGTPLNGDERAEAIRVRNGIKQVLHKARLNGKPAIIVHGRSDALIPVNHTSRPYYGMTQLRDRARNRLRYYEVANAQHFDVFIQHLPGYYFRFVPLHYYFTQAMDLMYAHLKQGAPLPASQVVRTIARGGTAGAAPAITRENVPAIKQTPAHGDRVLFRDGTLRIPD